MHCAFVLCLCEWCVNVSLSGNIYTYIAISSEASSQPNTKCSSLPWNVIYYCYSSVVTSHFFPISLYYILHCANEYWRSYNWFCGAASSDNAEVAIKFQWQNIMLFSKDVLDNHDYCLSVITPNQRIIRSFLLSLILCICSTKTCISLLYSVSRCRLLWTNVHVERSIAIILPNHICM